jgi:uroporphyrin-3 C-methyltransferase
MPDDRIEDVALEEPEMPEKPEETPVEQAPAKRRGNGVAWLALLASLLALAAVGYTVGMEWLAAEDTTLDDAIGHLDNRLSSAQESLGALDSRIAELDDRSSGSDAEIDALRGELDERVRALSSLPARMSTLESSVSSLAGISEGARDAWLIAEAEYYMQIANAQLQLANKPELAALALRMADERVIQMSNPALIDVRRAISDELTALDGMEKPDIAGATMTLASLARVVESLPLSSAATTPGEEQEAVDEEQSGLNRAWTSMKNAMSGLVKVTPPDQAKLELLSPDAELFLRSNLALQLQSARLALLRGEQAIFEQSLDDAGALISQYFDSENAQVASARETLVEIRGSVFASTAPDISESLRLLRQFRTLRENSQ